MASAGDVAQLTEAITKALALSDEERVSRAYRSRARAENFTWESSVAEHLRAYEMAMAK